jgi:thiamine biosynthesis lipoprotein
MKSTVLWLTRRPAWSFVAVGSSAVAAAERDALGTTARVAVWPPDGLRPAVEAVDSELERLDLAASRFRPDSEISLAHTAAGHPVRVSADLAEVIGVALAAARWTGGLADPTVGGALIALGYDRDFAELAGRPDSRPLPAAQVPGWRSVRLDGLMLRLPAGARLDLGATAKGLGADWAAQAASAAAGRGGVLVSLGGDIAAAGQPPRGGWPVLVTDEARPARRSSPHPSPGQVVRVGRGGLATSSITCRQWRRAGRELHHIVDPRTARPAEGPWRTVSVAAASCAEANAAATAAIVSGADAEAWLAAQGLPARLVGRDGVVRHVGGWPAAEGGELVPPPPRMTAAPPDPAEGAPAPPPGPAGRTGTGLAGGGRP